MARTEEIDALQRRKRDLDGIARHLIAARTHLATSLEEVEGIRHDVATAIADLIRHDQEVK